MNGIIEIITEAGYRLRIGKDYTLVIKGEKSRRFIGNNHRRQAVEWVIKAA
jgi:hypothetical protein